MSETIVKENQTKTLEDYAKDFKSCGINERFLSSALDYEAGKTTIFHMPKFMHEYINSEFGEYEAKRRLLNAISEFITDTGLSTELQKQGLRSVSEITYDVMFNFSSEFLKSIGMSQYLLILALYVDRESAKEFLNRSEFNKDLARIIVWRSGLSDRPEFYSGCDIWPNITSDKLIAIYNRYLSFSKDKALNMAVMALRLPTVGATEFLNSLYYLAAYDYEFHQEDLDTSSIDISNRDEDTRSALAFVGVVNKISSNQDDIEISKQIKRAFFNSLPENIQDEIASKVDLEELGIFYRHHYYSPSLRQGSRN